MGSVDTFESLRPHLLSVAYRMLGSAADAQDVIQEAWLRWHAVEEEDIRDPKAWLSVVATRLCLDRLKAERRRREVYPGPWLPEPVATELPLDRESISVAFLVILEALSPVERAVYLLHHVFEYPHREIARVLGMGDAAVRQAFHRAKEHIAANRPRFAPSEEEHARILGAFVTAVAQGDLSALTRLLARDATLWADGGGKVRGAAVRPIHGAESIARFLVGLVSKSVEADQMMEVRRINGWPSLVGHRNGKVNTIIAIETDGNQIVGVRNIINPDKLGLVAVS